MNAQQIEALEILSSQVLSLLHMRKMNVDLGLANEALKSRNKVIKNDKAQLQGQLQQSIAERFQETSIQKLLNFVVEDLSEEIEKKAARIKIVADGRLLVVEYQFRQLFYNLLSNTLKFAKPDVPPLITISLDYLAETVKKPAHFKIVFSDNGIGFDNQYSERIFNLFQRLITVDKMAGTGIGLTIVRKIVNNHGGIIYAVGNQNQGAAFTICIPDRASV